MKVVLSSLAFFTASPSDMESPLFKGVAKVLEKLFRVLIAITGVLSLLVEKSTVLAVETRGIKK